MAPQMHNHCAPSDEEVGVMVMGLGDDGETVNETHSRHEVRKRVRLAELALIERPSRKALQTLCDSRCIEQSAAKCRFTHGATLVLLWQECPDSERP